MTSYLKPLKAAAAQIIRSATKGDIKCKCNCVLDGSLCIVCDSRAGAPHIRR